jgi:DNA-binding transcriptional MerR regulator
MSDDHANLILELATQAHAVQPCSECERHFTRLFFIGAAEATQRLALEPWRQGKFGGLSWPQVAELIKETIEKAPLKCPECGALKDDDYSLLGLESTTTEELDETAKHIFNNVEGFQLKEINAFLDEFQKERPDDGRIDLVKRWTSDVLSELRQAYGAEVAARRNAPVWQTEERKIEKAELAFAHYQIGSLSQRLQYYESPEREKERIERQERASLVENVSSMSKAVSDWEKLYIAGVLAMLAAIGIDIFAFFARGEIYKFAGGAVIYGSAAITVIVPVILAIWYKDWKVAVNRLRRYRHLAEFEGAPVSRDG